MPKEKSNWKERAIEVLQKDASFLLVNHGASDLPRDFNFAIAARRRHFDTEVWATAPVASGAKRSAPHNNSLHCQKPPKRRWQQARNCGNFLTTGMVENGQIFWEIM